MTAIQDTDKNSLMELYKNVDSTYQTILMACSWLAPSEPLPIDLLMAVSKVGQETELNQNLNFLVSMNFLEKAEKEFVIQPKVSAFIQEIADKNALNELLQVTSRAMHAIVHPLEKTENFQPYANHIEKLAQHGQIHKIAVSGLLFGLLGRYKLQIGEFEEAVKFIKRALLIVEKVSGVESAEHTENMNNLGTALHRMGRFEDAKKCFEQTIIIDKKILGKKDPAVAIGHNNLGQVLIDMNSLDGAIIHLEKALEINIDHFGKEHYLVASGHYNLGMALMAIGDFPRARAQLELALAKRKKNFGDDHLDVAEAHHGLGMILQTIGNAPEALEHYKEAVRIYEAENKGNLKLAASYTNLGGILHVQGEVDLARSYYQKALVIFEAGLPADDKNIRDLQLQLHLLDYGMTMADLLEKLEAGEQLPEEIMKILEESFGDETTKK
ncbi:MAG: tetratricopeptide repeat protein [Anaerolineaceae bacterium]|nr:tetratricopeptide repeat protein [Anaerolineaceae bacterium]